MKVEDDGKKLSADIGNLFTSKLTREKPSVLEGVRYYMLREMAEHNNANIKAKESELGGARFDVHLTWTSNPVNTVIGFSHLLLFYGYGNRGGMAGSEGARGRIMDF